MSKMDARLHSRILRMLDALNEVERPEDMNLLASSSNLCRAIDQLATRYMSMDLGV